MAHALETIAAAGNGPATAANSSINQPLANEKARYGAGEALASMLIDETIQQSGKLKMYVQSLMDLDADGRKGFLSYLSGVMKERKVLVKENGTKLYKYINASASVRLSEFRKIAEAIGKGYSPNLSETYETILGRARQVLEENGVKETRGRPKTHGLVKALKYLAKVESISEEDAAYIAELYEMAKTRAQSLGLAVEGGEDAPL